MFCSAITFSKVKKKTCIVATNSVEWINNGFAYTLCRLNVPKNGLVWENWGQEGWGKITNI